MAISWNDASASQQNLVLAIAAPFVLIALILSFTRISTTINYYRALHNFTKDGPGGQRILAPPQIPYTLPWLGNALSFLTMTPGRFWDRTFAWYPASAGVLTMLVGGRRTHVLFAPAAISALFRAKAPTREGFEAEMYAKVFLMDPAQIRLTETSKQLEHEVNSKYLTNFERVNELTATFTAELDRMLARDAAQVEQLGPVGIYEWLRDRMFDASVIALDGKHLLEMYPQYGADFFKFEPQFLAFLFETPKFMMRDAIATRERLFDGLEAWGKAMRERSGGSAVDPEGVEWEPYFGSRLNRARQIMYKTRGLSTRTAAALDLGMTFALGSNVIPITGWLLFHILNPASDPNLYPDALAEVKRSVNPNGTIDVPKLMSQPLLQSLWSEALRVYADVLVTRSLPEDLMLPVDEDGKTLALLRKGDSVFVPSWVNHRDASTWRGHSAAAGPVDVFDPYRFVSVTGSGESRQLAFKLGHVGGRYFPFGGGKTICPGRTFAKQEGLGALAMVLLRFEFEVQGYVNADKKACAEFPGLAKGFPGTGAILPAGDVMVKIRRRGA